MHPSRRPGQAKRDPGPIPTGSGLAKTGSWQLAPNHSLGLWVPAFAGTTLNVRIVRRPPHEVHNPYAFNVSKNRTGSPCDGVTSSLCHITRLPRRKVPTGQP